jgi:hypothetical protein
MENILVIAGLIITLGLAILGWAYQLGFMGARVQRNEKDIDALKAKQERNDKDMRTEIRESFNKVYQKLDDLPCHNPKWDREGC